MPESFDRIFEAAGDWARRACAEGWLGRRDIEPVEQVDRRSPAALFEAGAHRPLVAAFFGGTGVGKSSLLNRLAGHSVARIGVERPTSREVSIYLHASVKIQQLPRDFPLERVRTAYHHDERRRQVLWIDMPDIDSIERSNRKLVLEWLPHIDVLIYVVSPERYRDDSGWRLLKAHGCEHAWLFVMNQWDHAHPSQLEDFQKLLVRGGFAEPVLLRTDCQAEETARMSDDFPKLEAILQKLADRHVIRQLEMRAEELRCDALRATMTECLDKLGGERTYAALKNEWRAIWRESRDSLLKGLDWPIQEVGRTFARRDGNPLLKSIKLNQPAPQAPASEPAASPLWDEWAQTRLDDAFDRLVVEAGNEGLPVAPLKAELKNLSKKAGRAVFEEMQRGLRHALSYPGSQLQRFLVKMSGVLLIVLPLAAMGWVSFQVIVSYYESSVRHTAYLGTNFAIHSILLITIAWILPYFLHRQLTPSAEQSAVKGLRAGLGFALERIGEEVTASLLRMEQSREKVMTEGRSIVERCELAVQTEAPSGWLERLLPTPAREEQSSTVFRGEELLTK